MKNDDHPLLMSVPLVQQTIKRLKTKTRRIIKSNPAGIVQFIGADNKPTWQYGFCATHDRVINKHIDCPYGKPGSLLWVREKWQGFRQTNIEYDEWEEMESPKDRHEQHYQPVYAADGRNFPNKWLPSIFMPREFSRITLEITNVSAEKLQDISISDALAEGMAGKYQNPIIEFKELWDSLNASRGYGWAKNPWVWAIEYKAHLCNIDDFLKGR